jgi:GMP synthase (glutamine-hydrolysing)
MALRNVLVCQHVAVEPLGTLDALLRARRVRIRYVNFARTPHARPQLDGYDALVVLGGPMNVDEQDRHPHLAVEAELLREAVARDLPVLGICLGAQLLAHALGAHVGRNPVKEHGWYPLALTDAGRADPVLAQWAGHQVCQWHGDTFELPPGAELLATGDTCRHQAFRVGRAYGVQFHPEVDARILDRWLEVYRDDLPAGASQRIRLAARSQLPQAMAAAERLFSAWLGVAGWVPRRALVQGHGSGRA